MQWLTTTTKFSTGYSPVQAYCLDTTNLSVPLKLPDNDFQIEHFTINDYVLYF